MHFYYKLFYSAHRTCLIIHVIGILCKIYQITSIIASVSFIIQLNLFLGTFK